VISLVPVGEGAGARGQLFWEPMRGGTLVVSGLPQPGGGRTYQFWLGSISLGNRISAGLLAVDLQGAGTLRVAPPRASWSPDIFGVTVERQGGAREPSDELVLVGELTKLTASAPAKEPGAATASPRPPSTAPVQPGASALPTSPETSSEGAPGTPAQSTPQTPAPGSETQPSSPPVTASVPPSTSTRGPDGLLVRVVPVPIDRTWTVAQSALRSLGWDIDRADLATGVIRTEPRNVAFKDFGVYAEGTRHALDVVVRAVSSSHTSITVRREVFVEQRIFWAKERKVVPTPETATEQTVLDAIEQLL